MSNSKKETDEMRIDNLVYKLNHTAQQRKEIYDQLWLLEEETEKMRVELLKLINEREHC